MPMWYVQLELAPWSGAGRFEAMRKTALMTRSLTERGAASSAFTCATVILCHQVLWPAVCRQDTNAPQITGGWFLNFSLAISTRSRLLRHPKHTRPNHHHRASCYMKGRLCRLLCMAWASAGLSPHTSVRGKRTRGSARGRRAPCRRREDRRSRSSDMMRQRRKQECWTTSNVNVNGSI